MKKATALLALLLASVALAACGSGDDGSTSIDGGKPTAGGATLKLAAADKGLAFSPSYVTIKSGEVTVVFDNPQPIEHNVVIERSDGVIVGQTDTFSEGSDSFVADLEPGPYSFYCTVPGHYEAKMLGTLKVE